MEWIKEDFLHTGKAKSVYTVKDHPGLVWMEFKDNLTAFNGKKKSSFKGKGEVNRDISSLVFQFLKKEQINNHWVANVDDTGMICQKLKVFPLEVVVRNRLAGSTAGKFQISEGSSLSEPLVELYYKKDELEDPFISSEQAIAFGFVSTWDEIELLKKKSLEVNEKLKYFFATIGLDLIDFKLEFGKLEDNKKNLVGRENLKVNSEIQSGLSDRESSSENKQIFLLGDEISCDSCRLWDRKTGEKMDKDRFRLDLGAVEESYKKVRELLKQQWARELGR